MPGGGDPVGGGVQATDDGRGTLLPGAAEGTGAVQGVRGGDGGCIDGRAHEYTKWVSGRGDMDFNNLGHWGRTSDVPHGLTGQGRPIDLPWISDDEDGDAGPFYAPACPGHRGHFGGGKTPPPTVPLMQHDGSLACVERKAPCHHTVRQRGGA